jgi:amino acid adenylation domain-containing protein
LNTPSPLSVVRDEHRETAGHALPESRLLLLSANDATALAARIDACRAELRRDASSLPDIAYTLSKGRKTFSHRAALVIPQECDIGKALDAEGGITVLRATAKTEPASVGLMFPGQGSQFLGMGAQLYDRKPGFRAIFDRCDGILEPLLGHSLRELLFAQDSQSAQSRTEALTQTAIAQPALFVIEYALARMLMQYGVQPTLLLGHSIGEYAAACLAGVFELEAALELVAERGRLMQSMPPGSMMAVKAEPQALAELCSDGVDIAAHNAPGLVVVSGPSDALERFAARAQAQGLDTRPLHTSHAFHSSMMEPVLEAFARAVERANPRPPAVPIVSTMTGKLLRDDEATTAEYWARQLRNPVRFADAVATACDTSARVLVETGPGVALMTSAANQQASAARPRKLLETLGHPKAGTPAMDAMLRCLGQLWLHGAMLDWDAVYDAPARRLVRLPTYPYSRRKHWIAPPQHDGATASFPSARQSEHEALAATTEDPAAAATHEAEIQKQLLALLESRLGSQLQPEDIERSFLELGFDSLALSQLVSKLRQQFGVRVPVRRMFEDLKTPADLARHLLAENATVVKAQTDLPAAAGRGTSSPTATTPAAAAAGPAQVSDPPVLAEVLARMNRIEHALDQLIADRAFTRDTDALQSREDPDAETHDEQPLTPAQREIWLGVQVGDESTNLAYNECRAFRFLGALDEDALQEALDELPRRHEALRQAFDSDGEFTMTLPSVTVPIVRHDLRKLGADERRRRLDELQHQQVSTPFDLEHAPLLRGDWVRVDDEETWLVLCAHHIAVDGSSWGILINELAELYTAGVERRAARLGPSDSFAAFAAMKRLRATAKLVRVDEKYWLAQLARQSEDLALPLDKPRPAKRTYNATRSDHHLTVAQMDRIRAVAAKLSCTPQTLLLGAFQILMHRLSRQTDFVVGIPISGQAAAGLEALVGNCVKVLPLRTTLDPNEDVSERLRKLNGQMLDSLEHHRVSFSDLLPKLDRPRDSSRPALVQVAFGMGRSEKYPRFADLETRLSVVPRVAEAFELYVYATEDAGSLEISWSYNTDLFSAETIALWQRCFETAINGCSNAELSHSIADLPILNDADTQHLLQLAKGPAVPHSPHAPIHLAIGERAARHGDSIAVVDVLGEHSFAALDARANRIAHWLQSQNLESKNALVAVCLGRSMDLVAVLLGVWRAGFGYVPLDPGYPAQRVQAILEDSDATLVLTSRDLRDRIPEQFEAVCIEDMNLDSFDSVAPTVDYAPDDTAYVIFTSGSTGRPKGVQIPQKAVTNFIVAMAAAPGFTEEDRLLAITTISFDISVLELFLPLYCGGRVVIASREQAGDPRALQRLIEVNEVTVMQATPATWQMLFDGGWTGSDGLKVLCGGEAFPRHLAERFLANCGETWNVYGPTETTVWSTAKRVDDAANLTIGRPIDNTTLYVLDERRALVPAGVHGELWIGGAGVATGYLGRPDLTAERFVASPFDDDRLYRTGDLARVRADGEFECLGRADFQVKIRGFRIELGEIESAVNAHVGVANSVVVAREDRPGDKRLVAYVVPQVAQNIDIQALRQSVSDRLPAYMVPSAFCVLDALPMTPNNKVDRKALPPPQGADGDAGAPTGTDDANDAETSGMEDQLPRNDVEAKVREVFVHHLGVTQLGIHDDFFAVGGHSLLAVRAVNDLSRAFGTELSVATLFENPTVEGVSLAIERQDGKLEDKVIQIHDSGSDMPLFFICGIALYQPLALNLGNTYSSYGVYVPAEEAFFEQNELEEELLTVEELARLYVRAIEQHPGSAGGRCVLGGISFGGLLAFEVARQLQRHMQVNGLVLLDTLLPGAKRRNLRATLSYHISEARKQGLGYIGDRVLKHLGRKAPTPTDHEQERVFATNEQRLWEVMNGRATRTYLRSRHTYNGDTLIVRAVDAAAQRGGFDVAPDLGWSRMLTGRVKIVDAPGDHLGILREPSTAELILAEHFSDR